MEKMKTFFVAILTTGYFSYIFGVFLHKDISCSYYQRKSVQRKRICSIKVSPLCASNNVTYANSCVFCFANMPITKCEPHEVRRQVCDLFVALNTVSGFKALRWTLHIRHFGKCAKISKVT
uniref:Kazal-like domain-containing protein n=1 Tax=Rousettus aegyptiacus TaxID=9407 RepID=A0A7J8FJ62_ROUAE|nr:hypothetical protein HJG63_012122 [Rousettus aegyptiacus]